MPEARERVSGLFIVFVLAKSPKLTKFRDLIPRIYSFWAFFALEIEMFQNYFEVLLDA